MLDCSRVLVLLPVVSVSEAAVPPIVCRSVAFPPPAQMFVIQDDLWRVRLAGNSKSQADPRLTD